MNTVAVKKYILNNPWHAENKEDLWNYCCNHFNIEDDAEVEEVYQLIRRLQPLMPK